MKVLPIYKKVSVNQFMSIMFNPPHPGGILAEELKHLGVSADDIAREIGVSSDLITTILAEKESITPEIAQKISQVLKVPGASTWVAMQADYDGWQSKKR